MTAKKKTLIDLMLDSGMTPESLDERVEYFVSDEPSVVGESWISGYSCIPTFMPKSHEFDAKGYVGCLAKTPYHPAKQGSQVVTKQQFIDAYNERIQSETNATTPPAQQNEHTEETKPIQQEVKLADPYKDFRLSSEQFAEGCKSIMDSLESPMKEYKQELPGEFKPLKSDDVVEVKHKATDTQIGGDHYTKLAIQPMQYSMENGLDALQHTVIKYVTRFRDKNGIEDLEKAKHCIDMLIEFEKESK